jgi:hypothetical protein
MTILLILIFEIFKYSQRDTENLECYLNELIWFLSHDIVSKKVKVE